MVQRYPMANVEREKEKEGLCSRRSLRRTSYLISFLSTAARRESWRASEQRVNSSRSSWVLPMGDSRRKVRLCSAAHRIWAAVTFQMLLCAAVRE
eukprot:90170-Rhodomonas_salina.1